MVIDVMDLEFDRLNFMRQYEDGRNSRGKLLYYNENAEITKVEKLDEDNFIISATVQGSGYKIYDVELVLNQNYIKECSCTCEDYYNGNICKHIIAASMETISPHLPSTIERKKKLLDERKREEEEKHKKFMEQIKAERKRREYESKYANAIDTVKIFKKESFNRERLSDINSISLNELYSKTREKIISKNQYKPEFMTNIRLEPRMEIIDNGIEITFKIGNTKMYVLKEIKTFYEAFLNEKVLEYGKNLRFIAKEESFEQNSRGFLKLILDYEKIINYNEQINDNYYRYSINYTSGKSIKIIEDKLDDLFDILKNKTLLFSNYRGEQEEYRVTDKELKILLNINKSKNKDEYKMKINLQNYNYISSNKYLYVFYKNEIYIIDKIQNSKLENILEIFRYSDTILIPSDMINEFRDYVFNELDKYIQTTNLPKEIIKEAIISNKLASKIYLDLDEKDNIILELKFCYLDYEFNILNSDYKKQIEKNNIVRNIIEETKVLERLFYDGFELLNGKNYFILKDQDATYDFLSEKVEGYMNDFEVLVTDKFKNKKIRNTRISNVSVRLENGLLELDISKIDISIDEIKDVLKSYNIKKKYYKLKNGDYLNLDKNDELEFLNDIQSSFDVDYDKLDKGIIKIPMNRSIYLEKLLNQNEKINTTKNDEFTKLITNVENKNFSENFKIEKHFEDVMRDYQKTGYKWLKVLEHYKFGGILADDMGLGKTLQVIALIASSLKEKIKPTIVVCPSSLVLNWKAEAEKWCKDLRILTIKGSAEERRELISECNNYDLIVTSYDLLKRDVFEYESKEFKYVIADEAQYIKNFATQNATALKSLNGETKFALTGTPIENSISELWSIFDFIMPGYLYNYNKFKKKFETPILKEEDNLALKKLKLMINPFVLRRVKSDVLTELPDKNITIMHSDMTSEQEKIYNSYFMQTKKEIAEELSSNGFEKSKFKILMLLTRLRQICCHPSLFIDNYSGESGKLNQCIDLIKEAIEAEHKILLFSGYTSMFEIIENYLDKEGISYYKLTGSTPVDKRVEMVDDFNKNKDIKIFLISLKAGGTGLNLTGADVVIHYDPWWNVSIENQATDRAYRIGQKNSVQVYKLITTNSIEEKINKLQEKKAKFSEQLLSKEEKFINKLSKEEIMELFE